MAVLTSRALVGVSAWVALACGGGLPRAEVGAASDSLGEVVPYPPPPARVEQVPASPGRCAVWVDGEWGWDGRRWAWTDGHWAMPPRGYTFTPWRVVRRGDGSLLFSPGFWRDASGRIVEQLPPLRTGRASEGAITRPEGHAEKTGPNVIPSAAKVPSRPAE